MAETQLDISTKKAIDELKALQTEIVKTGKTATDTKDDINDAFKVGAATGLADALDDLQKEFQQLEKSAKTLRNALKNTTDPKLIELYRTNIQRLEQGMKKLETAGKAAGVNVRELNREASTGRQAFEGFFGAISKATIIIAVIEAVRQFTGAAIDLARETAKAQRQFENFLGTADAAAEVVADLTALANKKLLNTQDVLAAGKGLLAFGESAENLVPVLGRIADISAATGKNFNELATIYGKARTAGVLYAEDINQLVDAGIPIIQEFAKQMGVSTDQVKKLASQGRISFEELQLAFFNLTKEGEKFAGAAESAADAGTKFDAAWTRALNAVGVVLKPAWDFIKSSLADIVNSIVDLGEAKGLEQFTKRFFDFFAQINPLFGALKQKIEDIFPSARTREKPVVDETGRDRYEKEKDQLEDLQKLEEAAAKRRLELAKKSNSDLQKEAEARRKKQEQAIEAEKRLIESLKDTAGDLSISVQGEGLEKELAAINNQFDELAKRAKDAIASLDELAKTRPLTADESNLKSLFENLIPQLEERRITALVDAIADANEKILEAEEKALSERLQKQQKGIEAEKALREIQIKQAEETFAFFIEKARQNGASEEEIASATAKFELSMQEVRLKNEIEFQKALLEVTAAGDTARRAQIAEQITLLEAQLKNVQLKISAPEAKKPFDLLEFLGVDADSRDEFEKAVSQIVDGIQKITDARVDAARAAVEAANEQVRAAEDAVDAAEEKLDREIEIAKTGEANNLALREQELAAAEKQAADAKKIREDAIKEQQKAAKAQLIVDSASQVSSIVTATANIFKTFSAIPFVGIALAAAQIASMIALFASIRARAKAISAQKLKRGGEVEGRDRVTGEPDSDGEILVRATPGEFVTNKRQSQRYKPLLEAINAGDVPKMALYLEGIKTGGRRDVAATAGVAGGVSVSVNATDPKLRDLMAKNNALQKRIFELEKNKSQVFDMGDHILRIKGGRRERIKKQQRR